MRTASDCSTAFFRCASHTGPRLAAPPRPIRVVLSVMAVLVAGFAVAVRAGDVTVRAQVDRDQVGVEDQISLEVVVEGQARGSEPPQLPPLEDFEVYSSGTAQQVNWVNGAVSATTTYSYVLAPKRAGKFTVGVITVHVAGKEYKTEPITITVTNGSGGAAGRSAAPGAGAPDAGRPAPDEEGNRDFFVVARVDKQHAYVNEQVLFTFYLYYATQISNPNYSPPDFQGFWVEKLKDSERQSYKMLNGRRYVVTELTTALFPTSSGKLTIEPATLRLTQLPSQFGFSFFDRGVDRVLRTKPLSVDVVALPVAGKPASFDGAVGEDLELSAKLDRTEVEAGDPVTLSVRIEGVGNVKTFSKPRLPDLPRFKVYDSTSKTDVQTNDRVSGSRTYEMVLVPKEEGELDLPPIQFAYFDTREARYRTLTTKPLHVTAVKSSHPATIAAGNLPTPQQDIQILGNDIAHIHAEVPVEDTLTPLYQRGLFLGVLPLPLLAAMGVTVLRRRRDRLAADVALARSTRARKAAKQHLAAAARDLQAQQGVAFYAEVSRALRQYVGDKLNLSATGLTHDLLRLRLGEAGVAAETILQLVALLERCDAARFAPGSMADPQMREALETAESLLVALDESWSRRGGRRGAVAGNAGIVALGFALLLPFALGGAGPARAAGLDFVPPAELIRRGNAAYEAGRFSEAVDNYTQAEREGVRNGALYYNLGNAYFKNGELGRSIACYRRAEMLSPRDAQVRANLDYALARREDKAVQRQEGPLVAVVHGLFRHLSLNEWVACAAVLYVLVCALWVWRTLRRSVHPGLRWTLQGATLLLALVLLLTAFKAHAVRGVERGVVTTAKVEVESGPGTNYTAEFSLHEGAELRIEERRGEWVRVSLGEKLHGWVPAASIEPI
jgi:tetratricopeptide (TPR) repeat protein